MDAQFVIDEVGTADNEVWTWCLVTSGTTDEGAVLARAASGYPTRKRAIDAAKEARSEAFCAPVTDSTASEMP